MLRVVRLLTWRVSKLWVSRCWREVMGILALLASLHENSGLERKKGAITLRCATITRPIVSHSVALLFVVSSRLTSFSRFRMSGFGIPRICFVVSLREVVLQLRRRQ